MTNLNELGVQEMSAVEMKKADGGWVIAAVFIVGMLLICQDAK